MPPWSFPHFPSEYTQFQQWGVQIGTTKVYFEKRSLRCTASPAFPAAGETRGCHLNDRHRFIAHQDSPPRAKRLRPVSKRQRHSLHRELRLLRVEPSSCEVPAKAPRGERCQRPADTAVVSTVALRGYMTLEACF